MIITADFSGVKPTVTTESLYQWDTGQRLKICGLNNIDENTQVHFANAYMIRAIVKEGTYSDGELVVDIPNEVLRYGNATPVKAWVYINSDTEGRYTIRTAHIPVIPRKCPNDYVSTEDPDAQGIIEHAVELLENYETDIAGKVSKPISSPNGTNGQLLRSLGDGNTEWVNAGLPTDAQTATAVSEWLDDHPEATTTVEDGAVTAAKIGSGAVTAAKLGSDVNTILDGKVIKPSTSPNGTNGQILRTKGDGTTEWVDVGLPTDAQTAAAVSDWLDDHPEATTTVEDGSVTLAKLHSGVIDSTLSTQGAAAEAEATGNGIGIAKNSIKGVSVPMPFPGRINPSGDYIEYANYISSDFIPINENSVFALSDWYTGASNNAYSFYDINKSFISGANSVQGNVLINTIPQNAAFVRFCSANEAWRNISPVATVSDVFVLNEVRNVQKSVGDNYKSIVPLFANFTDSSFIDGEGNAAANANYTVTDFIPVDSKTKIALIDFHVGPSSLAYAFYKSDYSFISGQNSVSGDLFVDTIPNSAKYVRLSSKLTRNGKNTKHIAVINNYHVLQQIVEPLNTNFFEGYNLFKTTKVDVYNNMICDSTGIRVSTDTWSMILPVEPNTDYYFYIPDRNRQKAVTTVDYPAAGGDYTFFEPIWVTTYNGTMVYKVPTTATAKYLMFYFYKGEYDLATNKENIIITKKAWNSSPSPSVKTDFLKRHYGSFSILGDSYSTFDGYLTPSGAGAWFPSTLDNNVTEIEQTWWYQFAQMYGSALKENVSWTGSTISYDGYGTGTDGGKSISFITRMENLTNPELILIYGGTNDSWVAEQSGRADFLGDYKYSGFTESDFVYFRPSVAYVLSELKKKHVGAHIIFMLNANLTNIRESVQVICEHYNIPLCELVHIDLTNAHPNQTGMTQIAKYITDFLNAGN